MQELNNEIFGFRLAYPDDYEVDNSIYHTFVFLAPQSTQGHRARAFLNVELAGDVSAEWFANKVKEENANLGTTITSSLMDIDGQQAVILGSVPGQDLNRQVFIIYKSILYHFTFMPDDAGADDEYQQTAYQQMETLYGAVINSLRFLPKRLEVPPVLSVSNMMYQLERAFEAHSEDDITRPLGDSLMIWYQTPQGLNYEIYGRNEASQMIIANHISQNPDLVVQETVDWPRVTGSPEPFSGLFPNETVTPVLVRGWGKQGSGDAVFFIGRLSDGSLFWRGIFLPLEPFAL